MTCFFVRERDLYIQRHKGQRDKRQCEDRCKSWSDAATSKGMPRTAGSQQKLGGDREDSFLQPIKKDF